MVNGAIDDQNQQALQGLEREVEEHIEKWVRNRYHDVLKEEISTDLINWLKLKYTVVAIVVGILTYFGLGAWVDNKANEVFDNKLDRYSLLIDETQLELQKALIEVQVKISDLQESSLNIQVSLDQAETQAMIIQEKSQNIVVSLDQAETRNLLLEEREVRLTERFASLEDKAETDAMLIHAATEKMESDIMVVLANHGDI